MIIFLHQVKVKCKSNGGHCRVQNCKKRGQFFKRLDKHLKRAHPKITECQHKALPAVEKREATHMRYRVKEECALCGRTLLLRPHLWNAHNIKTWDDYITKIKEKNRKRTSIRPTERKEPPAAGLNALLNEIKTTASVERKPRTTKVSPNSPIYEEESDSPKSSHTVHVPYTEEEFLRYCVHNTNLYMVLATHHAIKNGKRDPIKVLNSLSKNKLDIECCRTIVDMDFIPKLHGYYRFSAYYPYPKEKCISCSLPSCSCGKPPRSFYSFCRRACNTVFNCTVCKNWGSGYHTCPDFFWCDVCSYAAKKWPPLNVHF